MGSVSVSLPDRSYEVHVGQGVREHLGSLAARYDRVAVPVSYTHLTLPTNREV